MRDRFHWARLLSFVTGLVNQELLLRNEYLTAENRILRAHLPAPAPAVGGGAIHSGRGGQATRSQSSAGCRARCQTGYPSRLVSTTGGAEVRWLPLSCLSRSPTGLARSGGVGNPVGTGEPGLGI